MPNITVSSSVDSMLRASDASSIRDAIGAGQPIYQLDTTLANIAANTVEVTGPALAETTDNMLVYVVEGQSLPSDNESLRQVVTTNENGNLIMQQKTGLDSARQTVTPLDGEILWTTDLEQAWIGDGATLGGISMEEFRPSSRYIRVGSWGTKSQAGLRLLAALQRAKDLSPTSLNPVRILIGVGDYDLNSDFVMDTPYIEVFGENTSPYFSMNNYEQAGVIQGDNPLVSISGGDIVCSAGNITVANITMKTGAGIFIPVGVNEASQTFFNIFSGYCSSQNGGVAPFGDGVGSYAAGRFMWCVTGVPGFGCNGGTASGDFYKCFANGSRSFGGDGTASGNFVECISKQSSFGAGSGAVSSGRFIRCLAQTTLGAPGSFGGAGGTASGYYRDCKDEGKGFGGGGGTFSGEAVNCESRDFSGTITGKLNFCTCSNGFFATVSGSGRTRYCLNSDGTTDNQG